MAIERLIQTGFELGSVTAEGTAIGTNPGNLVVITGTPKTGIYSLRMGSHASSSYAMLWTIPSTVQFRDGFHVRLANSYTAGNALYVASWRTAADAEAGSLRYQSNTGQLHLYTSGVYRASISGININTWYHIGVDARINLSTGWAKVYVNGALVLSFSGNTGSTNLTRIVLGCDPQVGNQLDSGSYYYYDDITIDDTTDEGAPAPVPDRRWDYKASADADEAETYKEWAGSDGNSVDNYALVDEIPHNSDTDYVSAGAADLKDSYKHATFSLPANGTIKSVVPIAVAKKGDATDCQLALGTRLSATDLIGSGQALPTSYGLAVWERQTAKPGGGAWEEADVNAAELVIESDGAFA